MGRIAPLKHTQNVFFYITAFRLLWRFEKLFEEAIPTKKQDFGRCEFPSLFVSPNVLQQLNRFACMDVNDTLVHIFMIQSSKSDLFQFSKEKETSIELYLFIILQVVKYFVNCGVDLKSVDHEGATPLHYAAERNFPLASFLAHTAPSLLSVCDNRGRTPLVRAMTTEDLESTSSIAK